MAAMISPMPCRSSVVWLSALALAFGLAGLSGCAPKSPTAARRQGGAAAGRDPGAARGPQDPGRGRLPPLCPHRPGGEAGDRRRAHPRRRHPGGPPGPDRLSQGLRPAHLRAPCPAHDDGYRLRSGLPDQGRGHHHGRHAIGGRRPHPPRRSRGQILAGLRRQRQGRHHHPAAHDPHLRSAGRREFPGPLVGL